MEEISTYDGPIAIDTETTGLNIRDGRDYLIGLSLAWADQAIYLPFRHKFADSNYDKNNFIGPLQKLLDTRRIIFFNAKFDIVSLSTLGLKAIDSDFVDVMILAHLLNEELPYSKSLDSVGKMYCNDEGKLKTDEFKKTLKAVGWAGLPVETIIPYAAQDALLTLKIYRAQVPLVQKENLGPTWLHKREFMKLLITGLERRGIKIDQELCIRMADNGLTEMDEIKDDLGLNPASPKDLEELLVKRLGLPYIMKKRKGGKSTPTFDKDAMVEYEITLNRMNNPVASQILAYRGWQKSVSSNYQAYMELLSPDGRLRPNYKMHGTKTGRLSCEKPNLQQIPRSGTKPWNGQMKAAFIPDEDYELWEFDYSQLELRLGAAYGKERNLLEIFRDGHVDVFTAMSEELGFSRQDTKTLVYSMQYGAGLQRLQNVFGVSAKRAAEIRSHYFATYPGFKSASDQAAAIVNKYRKIPIWSGRYRHFLNTDQSYKAFNSVIQGGGADVVERTMLRLATSGFNTDECRMLLQVHDSVVMEIRSDLVQEIKPQIEAVMVAVPEPFDKVTMKVEGKVWGS